MSRAVLDAEALAGFTLVVGFCWTCGALLRPFAAPSERLGAGLLVVFGLAGAALVQRYLHASIVGHTWAVYAAALLVLGVLAATARTRDLRPGAPDRWLALPLAGALAVSFAGWWAPGASFVGDARVHRGWILQLAGGVPEPTAIYRDAPAAYPWLYHALDAALVSALPGGVSASLLVVQLLMLLTLGVGVWLLTREAGLAQPVVALATLLALAGGGPALRGVPPPTPALGNIAPALPRELGVAMTALVAWLGLRTVVRRSHAAALAAGAASGLVLATAPIAGVVCLLWGICLVSTRSLRIVAEAALAFAAVAALWLVGLANEYASGGGFQRISSLSAPTVGPPAALRTLAPLALLGVAGLLLARGGRGLPVRAFGALAAVPLLAYAAALLARGTTLVGTPAFSREVRYLPFAALALAVPAGMCLAEIVKRRPAGLPWAVALTALAVAAPLSASLRTGLTLARSQQPALACLGRVGAGPFDTVAVVGIDRPHVRDRIVGDVFASTGATTLYHGRPRVRVRDAGPSQAARRALAGLLARGAPPPTDVDYVIAPRRLALSPVLRRRGSCLGQGGRYGIWQRGGGDDQAVGSGR